MTRSDIAERMEILNLFLKNKSVLFFIEAVPI